MSKSDYSLSEDKYTHIGAWGGEPVNLRTKEDAAAIEVIQYQMSLIKMMRNKIETLEADIGDMMAASADSAPSIIIPH